MADRTESMEIIERELVAFARRARASATQSHPGLSLVSFSILKYLEDHGTCRATDLAARFLLDKTTISRQVAALCELGMVERQADPGDQRARALRLTARGAAAVAEANENRRTGFRDRLADWNQADLARFATYLMRYNAS